MSNVAVDKPEEQETKIQNTYLIGLLEMKMEGIPQDRQEIDNKFIVLLDIVEESYEGPSIGKQWEEWDKYR